MTRTSVVNFDTERVILTEMLRFPPDWIRMKGWVWVVGCLGDLLRTLPRFTLLDALLSVHLIIKPHLLNHLSDLPTFHQRTILCRPQSIPNQRIPNDQVVVVWDGCGGWVGQVGNAGPTPSHSHPFGHQAFDHPCWSLCSLTPTPLPLRVLG